MNIDYVVIIVALIASTIMGFSIRMSIKGWSEAACMDRVVRDTKESLKILVGMNVLQSLALCTLFIMLLENKVI